MTLRALVVDDSQNMRKSVIFALQKWPKVICIEAQDGAEALKKLTLGKVDIVLTDINMPLLDGLKLIAHIRQQPQWKTLPIVVITTESAQEDRSRALSLGANAYLTKPVQGPDVVREVMRLLPGRLK
jgi:two-component system chemotaxis response regulator CheY